MGSSLDLTMTRHPKRIAILALALLGWGLVGAPPDNSAGLSFLVAGDMRNFASGAYEGRAYFRGACQAMRSEPVKKSARSA